MIEWKSFETYVMTSNGTNNNEEIKDISQKIKLTSESDEIENE